MCPGCAYLLAALNARNIADDHSPCMTSPVLSTSLPAPFQVLHAVNDNVTVSTASSDTTIIILCIFMFVSFLTAQNIAARERFRTVEVAGYLAW